MKAKLLITPGIGSLGSTSYSVCHKLLITCFLVRCLTGRVESASSISRRTIAAI